MGAVMLSNPRKGDRVQVWYAERKRDGMPLHGLVGTVVVVSKKRPRNHGVEIDGRMHVVPAGNLRKVQ